MQTNSVKLWAHLNSLIKTKSDKDLPITPENLNIIFNIINYIIKTNFLI